MSELNDIFLLSKQLRGSDVKSDFDITLEFIKESISRKYQYQELIKKTELLEKDQRISVSTASEIKVKFHREIHDYQYIIDTVETMIKENSK